MSDFRPRRPRLRLTQILIANSAPKCWSVTAGDASTAELPIASRSTTFAREAGWVTTQTKI